MIGDINQQYTYCVSESIQSDCCQYTHDHDPQNLQNDRLYFQHSYLSHLFVFN